MFPFPGLVLAALAQLLDLTRTTVDLVTNLLSLFVANDCMPVIFLRELRSNVKDMYLMNMT